MRKGERWFYKMGEIFNKYLDGVNNVNYQGIETIVVNGISTLGGVFETVDPNYDLSVFAKRFINYKNKSCGIIGITCHKQAGRYRNCIIVHLS